MNNRAVGGAVALPPLPLTRSHPPTARSPCWRRGRSYEPHGSSSATISALQRDVLTLYSVLYPQAGSPRQLAKQHELLVLDREIRLCERPKEEVQNRGLLPR